MANHQLDLAPRGGPARFPPSRADAPYPGAALATTAGVVTVVGLGPAFGTGTAVAAGLGMFLAGTVVMLMALGRGYPHAAFGPANCVTLLRMALVAVLFAAVVEPRVSGAWAVPALGAASLILDGVDGWLARRTGLVSRFGARFDMEVDCAFALALALLVLESGGVGAWVLALGLARYVFWTASLVAPWLAGPLPERRSRKIVCVFQIVALIALVSPLVDGPLAPALAAVTLTCVAWSFAVDIRHLCRVQP